MKIYKINDGQNITEELRHIIPEELKTGSSINFIGIISLENSVILSGPKEYIFSNDYKLDAKIIFKLICSYKNRFGFVCGSQYSSFPMQAYTTILNYYYKYGLYKNFINQNSFGQNGNINWQKTLNKSNKIISGNNLIFLPLALKIKKEEYNILTECMDYILHDGYINFLSLFDDKYQYERLFHNLKSDKIKSVVNKLCVILNSEFKDSIRKLISSCIIYLEWKNNCNKYGFLTKDTAILWQSMVHNYLNTTTPVFQKAKIINPDSLFFKKNKSSFTSEKHFTINDNHNKYNIYIDHFLLYSNFVFIFDSKYYKDINVSLHQLNYKQISYYYLLRNLFLEKTIVSCLILPTSEINYQRIHIDKFNLDGLIIFEKYINTNTLVNFYLDIN